MKEKHLVNYYSKELNQIGLTCGIDEDNLFLTLARLLDIFTLDELILEIEKEME